jgi:predicted deacylase
MRRRFSGLLLVLALFAAGVLAEPAPAVGSIPAARGVVPARVTAVLETRVIGLSVEGRPIRAFRIGDPTSPRKAVFIATMHGNEAKPAQILRNLRDGRRIQGADIWVIPTMNPDGYARDSRRNAHGVDLNRNFPVHWIPQGGSYYSGTGPASEPETRAMMAFLAEIRPRWVVSFHQPLFGVDRSYVKTRTLARRLSRNLHLPRKRFSCNNGCHGTMTQWFNRTLPGAAITVEYGHHLTWRQKNRTGPLGLLRTVRATR